MLIYDTSNVEISYDPNKQQVIQTWNEFVPSEIFREAIDKTVEFVANNSVSSIISDTLKQRAVKLEDSDYAASVVPILFESGLKAMAFVIPENIFTKMALKKFADVEKPNNDVQYFTNMDEAIEWVDKLTH